MPGSLLLVHETKLNVTVRTTEHCQYISIWNAYNFLWQTRKSLPHVEFTFQILGRLRTPYEKHFHTWYGIFHRDSTKYKVILHWITMKYPVIPYENASRTGVRNLPIRSLETSKWYDLRNIVTQRYQNTGTYFQFQHKQHFQWKIHSKFMARHQVNHTNKIVHNDTITKSGRINAKADVMLPIHNQSYWAIYTDNHWWLWTFTYLFMIFDDH